MNGAAARVGSGGRYDVLTAAFGKSEPAVGFVLDLDSLTTVLLSRQSDSSSHPEQEPETSHIANRDSALMFGEAMARRAEGARVLIDTDEVTRCTN